LIARRFLKNMHDYVPVIGLEIHVQLGTKSKMFSRCSADCFGKEPNSVVCPVSLGLPGALPVPNKKAIQWAILIGMALNCKINTVSKFDRKHYFYPDLPKGYQISQYDEPFSYDGSYDLLRKDGSTKKIRIKRVHLEEDTGKLIHDGNDTLVDFNRAGVPLVEIVTEPDFDNSDDVKQFLEELQVIVRYLKVSDADMEKGSMRLEPNISVRKPGQVEIPNYKVEIKNINSFRFVKAAIDYEIKRHIELLGNREVPIQETRGYQEQKGITVSQRVKETAEDYRYFPEPDIPPFEFTQDFIHDIRKSMPELPNKKIARFQSMGVSPHNAYILTRDRSVADFYEEAAQRFPDQSAKIAMLIVQKSVPINQGIEEFCLRAVKILLPIETDLIILSQTIRDVIREHEEPVQSYKNGKESVLMFLVGQVMKAMQGKADAKTVKEELLKELKRPISSTSYN